MWLKVRDTLARIAEIAEGVVFTLENLNLPVDHPGTGRAEYALPQVDGVNHPRPRLNLDLYHAQIGEGNLIKTCRVCLPWIGACKLLTRRVDAKRARERSTIALPPRRSWAWGYRGAAGMKAFVKHDPEQALQALRAAFTL
ncbi:hypothetical protein A6U91_23385 [Agrobacterium tumefaciens]|jgi:hydroxypyruvate isomerase|uniref:Hydroxypyruvate isomerase n=1 Tax=Agrobacterium tumefaciens TaxID=358 RepID=A0AB36EM09_AGRTU|nr:hypothetical protein A6U91_23385 [Agrobacterium tumefaciens]